MGIYFRKRKREKRGAAEAPSGNGYPTWVRAAALLVGTSVVAALVFAFRRYSRRTCDVYKLNEQKIQKLDNYTGHGPQMNNLLNTVRRKKSVREHPKEVVQKAADQGLILCDR